MGRSLLDGLAINIDEMTRSIPGFICYKLSVNFAVACDDGEPTRDEIIITAIEQLENAVEDESLFRRG